MGLDMYLTAKRDFYASEWRGKEEQEMNKKIRELFPEMFKTGNLDNIGVSFEVGYWRKANQIHKWFVNNCQDGVDDCRDGYASRKQLKELRDLCQTVVDNSKLKDGTIINGYTFKNGKEIPKLEKGKIIENPETAQLLLPTRDGFFFGGTDYDEWYLDDVKHTIEVIDKCLALSKDWNFYYHSSW